MAFEDSPDNIPLIGRGSIEADTWQRYLELGLSLGAQLVEHSVDLGHTVEPEKPEVAGVYSNMHDFVGYTIEKGATTSQAVKAYRGLLRIFAAQQDPAKGIHELPHLKLTPKPQSDQLWDLDSSPERYKIEIGSLQEFLDAVDDTLEHYVTKGAQIHFQEKVLPHMIGLGTLKLYRDFVQRESAEAKD